MDYVSHLGPYRVAAGDLTVAGMPGSVFAPVPRAGFSTTDVPVVAFAHGWLQPVRRYADTLRYFASWGIVAVAPATETGPFPSHLGFAADLNTSLQLAVHTRLGNGEVTVDPERLGLAGHSLGGGVAVLAAGVNDKVKAVATVNTGDTKPSAVTSAGLLTIPGLHLVGGKDSITPADTNGERIARAWAGPVQLRTLKKAAHLSVAEGSHWTNSLIGDAGDKGVQHLARMLMTAFFLQHLSGQEQLAEDLDGKIAGTELEDLTEE
ncbi:alpha/beta hydrolase [Nakamurella silvestris]|nr:alpha/beta hydrolase [Nakamurella silvestris]